MATIRARAETDANDGAGRPDEATDDQSGEGGG
jgi:hypothetical protein